jgi:hypothetical protein
MGGVVGFHAHRFWIGRSILWRVSMASSKGPRERLGSLAAPDDQSHASLPYGAQWKVAPHNPRSN